MRLFTTEAKCLLLWDACRMPGHECYKKGCYVTEMTYLAPEPIIHVDITI